MTGPARPHTRALGTRGEDEAERYLAGLGYRTLARNFRIRAGEIDLIGWEGPVLAFVEVRTRRAGPHGDPAETVGPRKRRTLVRVAEAFLTRFGADPPPCRFDVLAGTRGADGALAFDLIRDAFATDD